MNSFSKNICEVISEPTGINISQAANPRLFQRVYIRDSMLGYFPYGEVFLQDKQGVLNSTYYLFEGMKFNIKLGFPEEKLKSGKTIGGYIQNTYGWSEDQINDTAKDVEYLSGINSIIFNSDYYFKDFINPVAYKTQPSTIARNIAENVFKINDSNKIFIDNTTNDLDHIWYQGNRTSVEFIQETLVKKAYGSKILGFDKVPFVSFINCNGEFYFCSYATLFNQSPVATYEQKISLDKLQDPFAIQDIKFAAGGAPLNKFRYNQTIHTLQDTGEFLDETILLKNKFLKVNKSSDVYPVYIENTKNPTNIPYLGIQEKKDKDLIDAQKTFMYQNSCLAFRLDIVVLFNPKAITGKVVEIKIKDFLDNDNYSSSLSGNWLIIESEHYMDQDAAIYSHLTLARPSVTFKQNWPSAYRANVLS